MSTVPFRVKAVFEYKSEEPDDLNFPNGQIISVTDDTDEDWYTGEYTTAAGDKIEGIFPRNFVEKYEPAIPSRPSRTPKKTPASDPAPEPAAVNHEPPPAPEPVKEAEIEPPHETAQPPPLTAEPQVSTSPPPAPQPAAAVPAPKPAPAPATSTEHKKGPPPVADKPSSSSFRDRIAAFNKPAAAPVTPFKPGGQGASSGFIKKPFVAPPPSKNAFVPVPREPPPQKVYRREEDPSMQEEEGDTSRETHFSPPSPKLDEAAEDQPKPTSLKDRIALLQKQQLEQAQRHAESAQKKEKPKKPPKKRPETEEGEVAPTAPIAEGEHLDRLDTNETVTRRSMEGADESEDAARSPPVRQLSMDQPTPKPPRELVSDTNDADDSGAADTEDAQGTSTEEDRPRSKGQAAPANLEPIVPKKEAVQADKGEGEDNDEDDEEEEEEEEEDPEVKRRRELRDRMAKIGGGMGMMGMFGPPGGMPAPMPRKSRPSTEAPRQSSEQHHQEEVARAPPVPMPGMSSRVTKQPEQAAEAVDDEDDTAETTPHDLRREIEASEDYISKPPKRSSTGQSSASFPGMALTPWLDALLTCHTERSAPPPPARETRAPPPPPPAETRAVPPPPQSPPGMLA
jgi:myosin tail region-interacting protein MTI1